jgi:hypothetical protein
MAISSNAMKSVLSDAYKAEAPYGALFTADPGTTGSATGEVTGGAPAYARKAISWGTSTNGVVSGTATFDVPSGTTVTYAGVCKTITATTADVRDRVSVTSQTFSTQGTYTVTFTFTES